MSSAIVPTPASSSAHSYRIIVFLSWRKELVQMIYPDETDAWIYRDDCGSYSQFRWSLRCKDNRDIVQLVVKHNSCINSLFVQPYCTNCQMRETWRQPCTTPEDVFFALNVQPQNICNDAILPLIQRSYSVNSETIAAYLQNMPRPLYTTKTPKQNDRTKRKMLELKAKIKVRVYEQNKKADADALKSMQDREQLALDALKSGALETMVALQHSDTNKTGFTDTTTLLTMGSMEFDINELLAELK